MAFCGNGVKGMQRNTGAGRYITGMAHCPERADGCVRHILGDGFWSIRGLSMMGQTTTAVLLLSSCQTHHQDKFDKEAIALSRPDGSPMIL
jgi:hypothetical protein